jgi:hypothetical protein
MTTRYYPAERDQRGWLPWMHKFLNRIEAGEGINEAARNVGVWSSSVWRQRRRCPDFDKAVRRAQARKTPRSHTEPPLLDALNALHDLRPAQQFKAFWAASGSNVVLTVLRLRLSKEDYRIVIEALDIVAKHADDV